MGFYFINQLFIALNLVVAFVFLMTLVGKNACD
jgi:hypothetical protein